MSPNPAPKLGSLRIARSRAAVLLWLAASSSCGRAPNLEPPVVLYGQMTCAHCNMIVNEERFAAASRADTGEGAAEPFVFDDVSCLFAFERAHPEAVVRIRFVHDARSGEWIDASSASYVKSGDIRSPMGGGVLAAGNAARADSLGAEHGAEVVTFERLRALFEEGS